MVSDAPSWAASPTTARRWLARQMRSRRKAAGVTVAEAATALDCKERKVTYLEDGERPFKSVELEGALFGLYAVPEADRELLREACRLSRQRGWWQSYDEDAIPERIRDYVGLEQGAATLRSWGTQYLHDLLQAEPYASVRQSTPWAPVDDEVVAARVEAVAERRTALTRQRGPLVAHFVVDEAVLHRVVGDKAVMAAQLDHLLTMATWPNVTLQVVPFTAAQPPAAPCTLLGFGEGDPGFAHLEGLSQSEHGLDDERSRVDRSRREYIEDITELADHETVFAQLTELALPPDETVALIERMQT